MSQVRTRKRGKTYSYIFEAGKKDDGKRKVVEKGGYATQKEAYNAGVAAYTNWLHGDIGITSEKITLKDFMMNWLKNVVPLNVKASTLQMYIYRFETYIKPYMGEEEVQNINPAKIDKFLRELTKQNFSRNTLLCVNTLLSHALDYAVYPAQIISFNPAKYIKVSKRAPTNIVKRTIITQEQFGELLTKFPFGTTIYIPLLLLYHTGMRVSEVCSLTWEDIDLEKKVIKLHRQFTYFPRKGYYINTLKTESSVREIMLDSVIVKELKRWKIKQAENELELAESYVYAFSNSEGKLVFQSKGVPFNGEKINLVCTQKNGKWTIKESIEKALREENLNAHSFRHTHATVLIENGATPKGVAGRLGHSNAQITQNLYTHNTTKLQGDTASIFEKTLQTNT